MTDLPEGWVETPLGDILIDIRNGTTSAQNKEARGVPVTRIECLQQGRFQPERFGFIENTVGLDQFFYEPGDLAFSHINSLVHVGKVALYEGAPRSLLHGMNLLRLRPAQGILPKYLYWCMTWSRTRDAVRSVVNKSVNQVSVNQRSLSSIRVPLAPLAEQKRIADKLDDLLARVDACHDRLDRVPLILKRFRQVVLAAATSGELTRDWRDANPNLVDGRELAGQLVSAHEAAGGHRSGNAAPPTEGVHDLSSAEFPVTWGLVTLRDAVEPNRPITYGILKPGPEIADGVPYVRVADFPNDRLSLSGIRKTSHSIDQEFRRSRLQAGDLLLSIRGTVGRIVLVPPELENANITQDTARLSVQPSVNPDYILWVLRSEMAQLRMKRAIKGVAVRGINIGDVRALQIPLPSRAEQDEIVRRVFELLGYCDVTLGCWEQTQRRVQGLASAILAKAFRGELIPQDPDDEPASDLLERIRTERSTHGIQPKKRGRSPKVAVGAEV